MIRPVKKCELCACVRLIRESFLTVAGEFGFTEENAPRFTAFATTPERLSWQFGEGRPMTAYFDGEGRIVGYYSLHIKGDGECELNNLCVLPECRHKRIGEILFSHAAMTAGNYGCRRMELGIVEENKRLRAWYEKLGAVHTGTKKFDFFPFTCGYMEMDIGGEGRSSGEWGDVEFWDAYLADGTMAGCDLVRGEEIPDGLRHMTAEVFVLHRDGSVLLMQRDFGKPNEPGLLESGAGGAVLKGEGPSDAARRELFEETGILVPKACVPGSFGAEVFGPGASGTDFHGRKIPAACGFWPLYDVVTDTTIYRGYVCVTDFPKEKITLKKGETVAFCWVSPEDFLEIFSSGQFVGSLRERLQNFVDGNFLFS